jgi:hypothetical protein
MKHRCSNHGRRTCSILRDGKDYILVTNEDYPTAVAAKTLQEAEQKLADKTGCFVYNPGA